MQHAQRVTEHGRLITTATRVCERAELTLTFMEVGARAVISLFILSAMPGNIVVPACTPVHVNHPAKTAYTHCPMFTMRPDGVSPTHLYRCALPQPLHILESSSVGMGLSKQQC